MHDRVEIPEVRSMSFARPPAHLQPVQLPTPARTSTHTNTKKQKPKLCLKRSRNSLRSKRILNHENRSYSGGLNSRSKFQPSDVSRQPSAPIDPRATLTPERLPDNPQTTPAFGELRDFAEFGGANNKDTGLPGVVK